MNNLLTATKSHLEFIANNHHGEVRTQITDRIEQINSWLFTENRRGISEDRKEGVKESCNEWLRWK